ncbi:hypothetical protein BDP27DRAFT_1331555 [Rhodocollybia butyracea]|uniref:Uncharacterized protein n=1 Tax=Rhodocollybia butyracea TaxID=206335 RepID=A0A9P5PPT5_9AGAR|nr:hypothetical protein BDP27DRAFT_1331555 [Rhodocollybia butyracea]
MSHLKDYYWTHSDRWTELSSDDEWYTLITHITALPHHPLEFPNLPAPLRVVASACKDSVLPMLNDTNGEILILPQYPEIVKRIARIYREVHNKGLLIKGQPGIGKSVFVSYVLFVLLSLKDEEDSHTKLCSTPVFLYTSDLILFYNGKIYKPKDPTNFYLQEDLPKPRHGEFDLTCKPRVWVLVDLEEEEPRGLLEAALANAFIVYSSSHNPTRYEQWVEEKRPQITVGLPLWTRKSLIQGWDLQAAQRLLNHRILSWARKVPCDYGSLPKEHRAVLKEDLPRAGWAQMTDDEIISRATELLIGEAIFRYGKAARDIYFYLQSPAQLNKSHKDHDSNKWPLAINFLQIYLGTRQPLMMESERSNGATRLSHRICALKLKKRRVWSIWGGSDSFSVVWKSKEIERAMLEIEQNLEEAERAELFRSLSCSESHPFGAILYEPYVHKVLADGEKGLVQMQPMTMTPRSLEEASKKGKGKGSTIYTFQTTDIAYSKYEEFPRRKRSLLYYSSLPDHTQLHHDVYYVPKHLNNPSFFFWELDNYIIAVFVHIYSGKDGDGGTKLADIGIVDELKTAASVQFGKDVEVMYLLIAPELRVVSWGSRNSQQWKIPAEYFEPPITQETKGRVFYLGIPLPDLKKMELRSARLQLDCSTKARDATVEENVITKGREKPVGGASWRASGNIQP